MKNKFVFFLYSIFLITSLNVYATHLLGGEITYRKIDANNFEVTMLLYRDCLNSNTPFDDIASFAVLNLDNNRYVNGLNPINVRIKNETSVQANDLGPCATNIPTVCVRKGVYNFNISLNPNNKGYKIIHQRCCRNESIINLVLDNIALGYQQGMTLETVIPAIAFTQNNSSPVFKVAPPLLLCPFSNQTLDFSATDSDGDVLRYEICAPLYGANGDDPGPSLPYFYSTVRYANGYNFLNPLGANSSITIDSISGQLFINAANQGAHVIGVCINEIRNGVLIGRTLRDFQFNIANCRVPNASFIPAGDEIDANTYIQCENIIQKFSNKSISSTNYFWDFGVQGIISDTSTAREPIYQYPDTGLYKVTLIIDRNQSCADTTFKYIYIYPTMLADFNSFATCFRNPVLLTDQSISTASPITTSIWNVGGINNTGNTTSILFNAPGDYAMQHIIANEKGCRDTITKTINVPDKAIADFAIDGTKLDDGSFVKCDQNLTINFTNLNNNNDIFWDFGVAGINSDTSIITNPSYSYSDTGTYTIKLIIDKSGACPDTIFKKIRIYPLITNDFLFNNSCVNERSEFKSNSTSLLNDIIDYNWNFGDANSGSGINALHDYQKFGLYDVSLIITTAKGCKDTATKAMQVYPIANIDFSWKGECIGDSTYLLSETSLSEGSIFSYQWNFGDGKTAPSPNASHQYIDTGSYEIELIAVTDKGCKDTLTKIIVIQDSLTSDFEVDNDICLGDSLNLNLLVKGNIENYLWNFGNGDSSQSQIPNYLYSQSGNYNISLTISNRYCNNSVKSKLIEVKPLPIFDLGDDKILCIGDFEVINVSITDYDSLRWSDNTTNIFKKVDGSINGYISLKIYEDGCNYTDSIKINLECDEYIPNSFSPNGDGLNDVFNVIKDNIGSFNLAIYNRWGQNIFNTNDTRFGWDGTYKGLQQPQDFYVYIFKGKNIDGDLIDKKGVLLLLR
jgi:gliding motility-associated-like protein